MKCLKFSVLGLLLMGFQRPALAGEYPVITISKNLMKYAHAVVRKEEKSVEIQSLNKVVVKNHYVITILDEAGEQFAYWSDYYSDLSTIDHVEGTLYDAMGNKMRSLKKSEIVDQPLYSASTMVDDNRVKYHNFYCKQFPYTVEYESEGTEKETMFLPSWNPIHGRNVAVEYSKFTLITDLAYEIRSRSYNIKQAPSVKENGKTKTMVWEIKDQPAIAKEYASPPFTELAPFISFAATDFKLGDFKGSMRSWEDYGSFISEMNKGLDELPPATIEKVSQITAGAGSDEEKVYRLYHFLQQNTHYINISLGIGGWRPFPASHVATKGYGDCKALSNYMIALLKQAGIKANYVLIKSGEFERDISVDFPVFQFDHAICAVPMAKDTIWLECTSQTKPAGYMGAFTGGRHALMITESGGKIVETPSYSQAQNLQAGQIKAKVDLAGNMTLQVKTFYRAQCSDDLHLRIHAQSKDEQLDFLKKNLEIPHYDVTAFNYAETEGKLPTITEDISIVAPGYAQITGKRLFIQPNILNKWSTRLAVDTARLYPIELPEERTERDSVAIELPEGYQIESVPKPIDLKTPYGQYTIHASLQGNILIYTRTLVLNKGKFPSTEYNSLMMFYEQIYKSDRTRAVLVKKEQ